MSEHRIAVTLSAATVTQLRAALARTNGRTGAGAQVSHRQNVYAQRRAAIEAELRSRGAR